MSHIPLKINGKQLCEIFTPDAVVGMSDEQKRAYSLAHKMYPANVSLTSETYSRNAERTADFELPDLLIVNRKAKPEFTWDIIEHAYVVKLLEALNYTYDFKNDDGEIEPVEAEDISIIYIDFVGERTINAYLGQTIEGTLEEYEGVLYIRDFRIAFPER